MASLRKLLFVVVTLAVVGGLVSWQAVGDPALKVRWTSALALNSLEEIDQRLATPWEYPLDVSRFSGKLEKAVIANCLSYFDLTRQGFESTPFTYQLVLGADCHALRALSQAVSAQRTHLAGLQLDEKVINDLPPDLSLVLSKDDARKVAAAHKEGRSWREFQPITRVTRENSHTMLVEGHGWKVRMEIYAFGDFNGDGVEDILVKTHGWLTEGTYAATRLLVLTRFQDSGRLHLVTEYNLTK
jgi:hypothetical protein